MEPLKEELSKRVYEEFFKTNIKEELWETMEETLIAKEKKKEIFYFGRGLDYYVWEKGTTEKKHSYFALTKETNKIGGVEYTLEYTSDQSMDKKEREKLKGFLTDYLAEKNLDILFYLSCNHYSSDRIETGKKAKKITDMLLLFKMEASNYYTGETEKEYEFKVVQYPYTLFTNTEKTSVALYLKKVFTAELKNKKEVESWFEKNIREEKKNITDIQKKVFKLMKEKANINPTVSGFNHVVRLADKDFIEFSIEKTVQSGKIKYQMNFNGKKTTANTLEKIEEKAVEQATTFIQSYRLRHLFNH